IGAVGWLLTTSLVSRQLLAAALRSSSLSSIRTASCCAHSRAAFSISFVQMPVLELSRLESKLIQQASPLQNVLGETTFLNGPEEFGFAARLFLGSRLRSSAITEPFVDYC